MKSILVYKSLVGFEIAGTKFESLLLFFWRLHLVMFKDRTHIPRQ